VRVIATTTPQPYSEALYQTQVESCLAGGDQQLLFAMRCQKFREAMPERASDLLFIPVGKKYQGPILAALAAPSAQVVLLCSNDTLEVGEQIRQALGHEMSLRLERIDPIDGRSVADKVQALHSALGFPTDVVCDQTGGQKPTTSTLAGLAALNDWRLLYINSDHKDGLVCNEEACWLPNLFEAFGGIFRWTAEACARHGAMAAAESELARALETSTASRPLLELRRRVRAGRHFREGDVQGFLRCVGARGKELQARPDVVLYWMVRTLWEEGQRLAAAGLAQQTWGTADVRAALARFRQQNRRAVERARSLRKLWVLDDDRA
jgi:hypothetical protein